jgi:hypothetical protein
LDHLRIGGLMAIPPVERWTTRPGLSALAERHG